MFIRALRAIGRFFLELLLSLFRGAGQAVGQTLHNTMHRIGRFLVKLGALVLAVVIGGWLVQSHQDAFLQLLVLGGMVGGIVYMLRAPFRGKRKK